jgi:hypothetical protein
VPTSDFSGFVSSICALANAVASAAIDGFGEGPWQHELGFEDRIASLHAPIQSCPHPAQNRVANSLLDIGNHLASIGLIPTAVEIFGSEAELDEQIAGEVLRLYFASFLAPEADEGGFINAHDDPGIRTADKGPAVYFVNLTACETF